MCCLVVVYVYFADSIASIRKVDRMRVTIIIRDFSNPAQPSICVHDSWPTGDRAELEIDGKRYTVNVDELISALQKVKLNVFGY